ncbi:MAG: hypothetical protein KDA89_09375 [Planctomycetaceae bacterium]|nr:hypothetical protein [Planctomycetaceae bacterium]
MAQQKNGPIIGLAIFAVLSIMFAVFWYMTWTDNQAKTAALASANNEKENLQGTVREANEKIATLLNVIGEAEGADVGVGDTSSDTVNGRAQAMLKKLAADGSPAMASLTTALLKADAENNKNAFTAMDRQRQMDQKDVNYGELTKSKDTIIAEHKASLDSANEKLVAQELKHSEEMAQLEGQVKTLRDEKLAKEAELEAFRAATTREIEDLNADVAAKRQSIIDLRNMLREKEALTFAKPDGTITSVDHESNRVFVNVGRSDGLQEGVTFSVYTQANSGVGKSDTGDIKGQIMIDDVIDDHHSSAKILGQDIGRPIAAGDPIYSPIFQTGQALEIAVAGRVAMDGLNRDRFRKLVTAAGAKIAVEVDDNGNFTDGQGAVLEPEDASKRITSRTRYLIIADLGDDADTNDNVLAGIYKRIQENAQVLRNEAENRAVHEVGLSTFLEFMGYRRSEISWRPESGAAFPGRLSHGARSGSSGASSGGRESSAAISGRFSNRGTSPTTSTGTTSNAYGSN